MAKHPQQMLKKNIQTIEDLKQFYIQNPENHPFYESNWKIFWNNEED
jgi:hypothetical protein